MALSEHEQQVLEELEEGLAQQDPSFARRVRSTRSAFLYSRRALGCSVIGFVAGVVVMLAFFTSSVGLGFLGAVMMVLSADVFWNILERRRRREPAGSAVPQL